MCLWKTNAPRVAPKVQIGYFLYKGHSQCHKLINLGVCWKGFISWEFMPNVTSLSLTFLKDWPRLKFLVSQIDKHKIRQSEAYQKTLSKRSPITRRKDLSLCNLSGHKQNIFWNMHSELRSTWKLTQSDRAPLGGMSLWPWPLTFWPKNL